jgi:PAS domain S-box-containing protein
MEEIVERHRVEETLDRAKEFHMNFLQDFPLLVWRSSTDAGCDYFNTTWLKFTGRALDDELGFGWLRAVHPDDREETRRQYLEAFHQRTSFSAQYRLQRRDGEFRWV